MVNTFGKHLRGAKSGVSSKAKTQRDSMSTYNNPQDSDPNWKHRIRILGSYQGLALLLFLPIILLIVFMEPCLN